MRYRIITAIVTVLMLFSANAQSIKKGIKKYDNLRYMKSIRELSKVAEKGDASSEVLEKLANAYYFTNNMPEASQWYSKLMDKGEPSSSESYYRYAMSLKTLLEYKKAKKWMKKFAEQNPNDSRTIAFNKNPNYLEDISNLSGNYELEKVAFNSEMSDFGTSFYKNGIVFASSRGKGKLYKWNEQPFLNLYYKENGSSTIESLSSVINTKYHESSTSFSKDGKTVYFTRNNYYKGKAKKNKERVNGLKIYRATFANGVWKNVKSLPFNSDDYNVAHPALTPDGKQLYFSSDMPGTLGKSDIYVVDVYTDGEKVTYGEPKNLGDKINTSGRENFPYVSDKGILYFSSNGHQGLGGLDVFKIDLANNSQPINVGKPVNSSFDDFEFILDEEKEIGYFTSNRSGGTGDDDIYSIKVAKCELEVSGVVLDKKTKEKISDAKVIVYNAQGKEVQNLNSDKDGAISYQESCLKEKTFKVAVQKEGYKAYNKEFVIKNKATAPIQLELDLEKEEPLKPEVAAVGTDLFKLLNMNPIYFDYNKANIRPDAQVELIKVINYMNQYPSVKIDVRSHTDARGRDSYNLALSRRRNKATKDWIISRGAISADRVEGDGYGETQIINHCTNGVKCTDDLHEQNRRSEFIVIAN